MASFREIRSIPLQSFDDGDISEDEFLILYDVNTSKNPDFTNENYGKFDLKDVDDSACLSEFRFRKSDQHQILMLLFGLLLLLTFSLWPLLP